MNSYVQKFVDWSLNLLALSLICLLLASIFVALWMFGAVSS